MEIVKIIGVVLASLTFLITIATLIFNSGILKGRVDQHEKSIQKNSQEIEKIKEEKKKEDEKKVTTDLSYTELLAKIMQTQSQQSADIGELKTGLKDFQNFIMSKFKV